MPEQPGAGRLDPETLAAYIDGLLPPEDRARVDAEIAADPETYEWVVNSIGAVDDPAIATPVERERGQKVLPFYRRRSVQGVLGALLATAAALVMVVRTQPLWWQDFWGPSVDPRFAKLVEAVGEERYIEARLSGGFKYGPLRPVMRGSTEVSSRRLRLMSIVDEAAERVILNPTVSDLHVAGVGSLLLGDPATAVNRLADALERAPDDVALKVDLAAALYAKYRADATRDDLERAERVLSTVSEPLPVELLYNLALIQAALKRPGDVWSPFLKRSREPGWLNEAERLRASTGKPGP